MKTWMMGAAALACAAMASVAQAQDASAYAGMAFLGEAMGAAGQPGVRVTGVGHARSDSFEVAVQGRASSAVQAAVIRDARLAQLREVASRYGLVASVGASAFSREVDTIAQSKMMRDMQQGGGASAFANPFDPDSQPMLFVARTSVRLTWPTPEKMGAFLDALKAAGVENLASVVRTTVYPMVRANIETSTIADEAARDRAAAGAIADARRQAEKLAAAAGRTLGPIEQVTEAGTTAAGDDVTVTVSVRFAFAPEK